MHKQKKMKEKNEERIILIRIQLYLRLDSNLMNPHMHIVLFLKVLASVWFCFSVHKIIISAQSKSTNFRVQVPFYNQEQALMYVFKCKMNIWKKKAEKKQASLPT